jgi:hydroxymethylbilane synthase
MIQTQWVVQRLRQQWTNLEITIEQIHTKGDRITNVPLTRIGSDGVFVTEIEHALYERRIDLAVHSLKDLPTAQPEELCIIVAGPREDVRDVFISRTPFHIADNYLHPLDPDLQLNSSLRIGTCSLRRTAQIQALCPGSSILPLRGNVDTRLRKLDGGDYDGIILASAGLHRMGLQKRLSGHLTYFPTDLMMPAPGQGALALECRDEPALLALLAPLQDLAVQAATTAERMFMRRLGAGCYLPVAAYGEIAKSMLTLRGLVISLDGQQRIHVQQSIPWTAASSLADAEHLGVQLAEQALNQGADEIVSALTGTQEYLHV